MSEGARLWLVVVLVVVFLAMRRDVRTRVKGAVSNLIDPSKRLETGKHETTVARASEESTSGAFEPEALGGGVFRKGVEVSGRDYFYLEAGVGTGRPSILLLHGFTGDKEQWIPLMTPLTGAGFHVVAPDLPGCGQSPKDSSVDYGVMSQVKRIRAFAHRVGCRTPHVVGSSMGGTIAAAWARVSKDALASLTLIEPFGLRVPYKSALDELIAQGRNPLIIAAPEAYDNLLGFLFVRPPTSDRYRVERAKHLAEDRAVQLKIWSDVREGERAHLLDILLPDLTVPALVIQGAESKIVHPATADLIRDAMPNARAVVIKDCGHFPMVEKVAETAEHLLGFLPPPSLDRG